ncbi:MAG: hypothetical protein ACRCYU_14935 [Nocardioides sp.]
MRAGVGRMLGVGLAARLVRVSRYWSGVASLLLPWLEGGERWGCA